MRVIRLIFSIVAMLVAMAGEVSAQVVVDAKVDPPVVAIGQPSLLTVEVAADAGQKVTMPEFAELPADGQPLAGEEPVRQLAPGVEIIRTLPADTQRVNEGRRVVVTNKYEITAYDSAIYVIDPLAVLVDSMAYPTKKLSLKVLVADIDTLGQSEDEWSRITPYKRQMEPPFSWEGDRWMQMLLLAFAVVVLTLVLLYVAVRLKDNKPIIRRIRRKKPQTPHQEAMGKIEEIRHESTQTEDPKTYYTQLTDILRQYIRRRYGFNAMEMTSAEIISKMEKLDDGTGWSDLQQLFTTADLVKFAKYSPLINENDQNLLNAIDFINRTKKVETEGTQETEVVVVDQQSRKRRTLLVTGIAVVSLLLLATVAYLAYRIVTMHLL